MKKIKIKFNQEDIKSVDQDYKGSQFYHKGEKIKIVNPDSKYFGLTGEFIKVEKTEDINDNYIVEINDYENIEMLRKMLDKVKGLRSDFLVDFVVEYDPDDEDNLSKMKILKSSGSYNSGIIDFDGLTDDLNYRQLTIGTHYNIKELYLTIKNQLKVEKEWKFQ